jgi:hypothetical protein
VIRPPEDQARVPRLGVSFLPLTRISQLLRDADDIIFLAVLFLESRMGLSSQFSRSLAGSRKIRNLQTSREAS